MVDDFLNLIDGMIITGGDFDVDPRIYGEKKKSNKVLIKQERTEVKNNLFLQLTCFIL
jgi:putative glutamine amidotransferase